MTRKKKKVFIALHNNSIVAKGRSARELARNFTEETKSNVWFSSKFKQHDAFTHLVGGRVFYFISFSI